MWYLAVVLFALTGLLTPAWAQTDVACHRCLVVNITVFACQPGQ